MSGTIVVSRSGDDHFASLIELPGCMARAGSRDEAVAAVRRNFSDYVDMLRSRGVTLEHVAALDPNAFAVRDAGDRQYPEDFRPLEEHELRDFLHQYEGSRGALLAAIKGLDQERLERRPAEGEWSVRECLEHIAATEATLLGRLEPWPARDFAALQAVHRMVFQRFSVMEPEDTHAEHRILGQRWSARRVMRRLLEHEYEHLQQIRDTIATAGR